MPVVSKREKTFKHYLDLPSDIRIILLDSMAPDDRCRFTRRSQLCRKEAKSSKKYLYSLGLYGNQKVANIGVVFCGSVARRDLDGYILEFKRTSGKKFVTYQGIKRGELWKLELRPETNLTRLAAGCFTLLMNQYQSTVKDLTINKHFKFMENFDDEIRRFTNLKSIMIGFQTDILRVFSKLPRHIEGVSYWGTTPAQSLQNYTKIYQISYWLDMPNLQLNNHQMLQLNAKFFRLHIGELTSEDITSFITSWQSGSCRDTFGSGQWTLKNSNFVDTQLHVLLGNLEINYENVITKKIKRHRTTQFATFHFNNSEQMLSFDAFSHSQGFIS